MSRGMDEDMNNNIIKKREHEKCKKLMKGEVMNLQQVAQEELVKHDVNNVREGQNCDEKGSDSKVVGVKAIGKSDQVDNMESSVERDKILIKSKNWKCKDGDNSIIEVKEKVACGNSKCKSDV